MMNQLAGPRGGGAVCIGNAQDREDKVTEGLRVGISSRVDCRIRVVLQVPEQVLEGPNAMPLDDTFGGAVQERKRPKEQRAQVLFDAVLVSGIRADVAK